MAVGYHSIVDEDCVPKPLSAADDATNHSEPLPGDPPPSNLVQPDSSDLAELQAAIAKLRIRCLVRMIIAYMVTHALLSDGSINPEHEVCPDCVLLGLLYSYCM